MAQQSFSIYLLKNNFNHSNSIRSNYQERLIRLTSKQWDNELLPKAFLYLQESKPKEPEWKNYFNIKENVQIQSQGSILFLPIEYQSPHSTRYFAITFGHSYHALKKNAIDHNFGLITTLNALKPEESIRCIDTIFPESNKREKIQSPIFSNLTFFQFNKHESIVKSLYGKVKDEYKDIFYNITGALSFKCDSKKPLSELKDLCKKLLEIYSKKDYEKTFPELTYIKPENDPDKIRRLDNLLLNHIHQLNDLTLSIPNFIDLTKSLIFEYNGIDNIPERYEDISFENYLDYLHQSKININSITLQDIQNHSIKCIDNNDNSIIDDYSIYECISSEITYQGNIYYLYDSNWYQINKNFIKILKSELDPLFISKYDILSNYTHKSEGEYNLAMSKKVNTICLDRKNIAPKGQTAVEPCDLLHLSQDKLNFIHIKNDTKSTSLSHLFNQGLNSLCLIRSNNEAKKKLETLISSETELLDVLSTKKYNVIYGIITHKDPSKLSDNLPLFSKISLFRSLEQFKLLGISCQVIYIKKQ